MRIQFRCRNFSLQTLLQKFWNFVFFFTSKGEAGAMAPYITPLSSRAYTRRSPRDNNDSRPSGDCRRWSNGSACDWSARNYQRRKQATGAVHRAAAVSLLLWRVMHHLLRPQDHQELCQGKTRSSPSAGGSEATDSCASRRRTSACWSSREETHEWRESCSVCIYESVLVARSQARRVRQ